MKRRLLGILMVLMGGMQVVTAQITSVTVSGDVGDSLDKSELPYATISLLNLPDSALVAGTVANEVGRFSLPGLHPGKYWLRIAMPGYLPRIQELYVGSLSSYLDLGSIYLRAEGSVLQDVVITDRQDAVSGKMEKQTYSISDNISQSGGSALQVLQNLPGVGVEGGKVQIRGNDKVMVLIDGRQTALTGIGGQSGLDNLPASSIDRVEIIQNPSSKFDANGSGGIVNIILKKEKQEGFTGKLGLTTGLGALWVRRENLPTIRPQYHLTPKINPSVFLNYRAKKANLFLQCDNLYTQTLNKNEFVTRTYEDGTVIQQQTKRNRNTNFLTAKTGVDWSPNAHNTLSFSGLYGSEVIMDRGDEPFFEGDLGNRVRLWQFLEDEVKTTVMASSSWQHKFQEPGHQLSGGFNYTFHREDERYFFDNTESGYFSRDSFKLLSDEHVADLNMDYARPLRRGRIECGMKFRRRVIPTNMQFYPGSHTALDTLAGGKATYRETIPALYGNYAIDTRNWEAEVGLRVEYVRLRYQVDPNHPTYHSDGYDYAQPFPNVRIGYKVNDKHKFTAFYNRRVDRPNEVDIRIFPKYDDAEIVKVGNPGLRPQFSQSMELGYKGSWKSGYVYTAAYHRTANGTITRISSAAPGSRIIYAVFQNAGKSSMDGVEVLVVQEVGKWYQGTLSGNAYFNQIDAFSVENLYPVPNLFYADRQQTFSWNAKFNQRLRFSHGWDGQVVASYFAPDIIPQGRTGGRFSVDIGLQKSIQQGKGQLFVNGTDILNTLVARKTVVGQGFTYTSADYLETQVIRVGYSYKF